MFLNFIQRVAPILLSFCLPDAPRSPLVVDLPANAPLTGSYRPVQVVRSSPKVGRNEPCPCGSGGKSKHCCGA